MVEPQIVVLDVAGSSPVGHPISRSFRFLFFSLSSCVTPDFRAFMNAKAQQKLWVFSDATLGIFSGKGPRDSRAGRLDEALNQAAFLRQPGTVETFGRDASTAEIGR